MVSAMHSTAQTTHEFDINTMKSAKNVVRGPTKILHVKPGTQEDLT